MRHWMQLIEAVFATAPLKQIIFGNNYAMGATFESDEPVDIYYRVSPSELRGLLNKYHNLRTVITPTEVYVADAREAAHAGMRSVLKQYGVDTSDSINTIITSPTRMEYAFGKYYNDAGQRRAWRKIRSFVLDHPRIKIMFPAKLIFARQEWS